MAPGKPTAGEAKQSLTSSTAGPPDLRPDAPARVAGRARLLLAALSAAAAFLLGGSGPADAAPEWTARQGLAALLAAAAGLLLARAAQPAVAIAGLEREVPLRTSLGLPEIYRLTLPVLTMTFAASSLLLCATWRGAFKWLEREDGPIESLTVALLLAAFLCFAVVAARGRRRALLLVASGGLAALLFVVAMEELSWFQRVLDVDPPPLFDANEMRETNLHNFATAVVNRVAFLTSFALLVLAPLLSKRLQRLAGRLGVLRLLPRANLALVAAPAVALALHWHQVETQIAFFFVLGLIGLTLTGACHRPLHRITLTEVHLAALALLFIAAVAFLSLVRNAFGESIELISSVGLATWGFQTLAGSPPSADR